MGEYTACNQCNNDLLFCLCFVPEALFLLAFSQAAVCLRMRWPLFERSSISTIPIPLA